MWHYDLNDPSTQRAACCKILYKIPVTFLLLNTASDFCPPLIRGGCYFTWNMTFTLLLPDLRHDVQLGKRNKMSCYTSPELTWAEGARLETFYVLHVVATFHPDITKRPNWTHVFRHFIPSVTFCPNAMKLPLVPVLWQFGPMWHFVPPIHFVLRWQTTRKGRCLSIATSTARLPLLTAKWFLEKLWLRRGYGPCVSDG